MDVYKTYVFIEGEDSPVLIDTIKHEGAWWLVGSWLASNDSGKRTPERIVRLTGLRYQEIEGGPYRFLLNNSIPKSVLDGKTQGGYVVAIHPEASKLPTRGTKH